MKLQRLTHKDLDALKNTYSFEYLATSDSTSTLKEIHIPLMPLKQGTPPLVLRVEIESYSMYAYRAAPPDPVHFFWVTHPDFPPRKVESTDLSELGRQRDKIIDGINENEDNRTRVSEIDSDHIVQADPPTPF